MDPLAHRAAYVGFVIFFFLGPRRLVRKRLEHRRARGNVRARGKVPVAKGDAAAVDPRIAQIDRLATRAGDPPTDRCDDVHVFHDAASTYDAIEAAIRDAKHHVHVAYYFDAGRVGQRMRDALVAKVKEGVTVRLLVDDVGSSGMTRAFVRSLRGAGVKLARFNPVTFSRLRSRFDFRKHRKIVVCDGVVGFTGGINVTDDYLPEGNVRGWRDTHVRIRGDAVRWLQRLALPRGRRAGAEPPLASENRPHARRFLRPHGKRR